MWLFIDGYENCCLLYQYFISFDDVHAFFQSFQSLGCLHVLAYELSIKGVHVYPGVTCGGNARDAAAGGRVHVEGHRLLSAFVASETGR